MSQCDRGMDIFCCSENVQTRLRNGDFVGFGAAHVVPIRHTFLSSQFLLSHLRQFLNILQV